MLFLDYTYIKKQYRNQLAPWWHFIQVLQTCLVYCLILIDQTWFLFKLTSLLISCLMFHFQPTWALRKQCSSSIGMIESTNITIKPHCLNSACSHVMQSNFDLGNVSNHGKSNRLLYTLVTPGSMGNCFMSKWLQAKYWLMNMKFKWEIRYWKIYLNSILGYRICLIWEHHSFVRK